MRIANQDIQINNKKKAEGQQKAFKMYLIQENKFFFILKKVEKIKVKFDLYYKILGVNVN